jgi:predicted nuclease of predicted toxin-antitoxin system
MRFFLDENFPKAAVKLLNGTGHDVIDIRGTDKEGADDDDLFALAQNAHAIFLTTDKDFFHTVPRLLPRHFGVVVVALRQPNRKGILARLSWLLAHVPAESFGDRVFLLLDTHFVVYPSLDL